MKIEVREWFDEKTAAHMLGISPRTVRAWRRDGKISYHRTPGGRIRFTLEQILDVHAAGLVRAETRCAS
jgi:excisionase family DNA binding protein